MLKNKTSEERAKELLSKMTLKEKVGQIAQPFKMFDEYEMKDGKIELSENFKSYIKEYGGIGTVFSLFRADPWSGRTFSNGITAEYREKVYNTVQRYIIENTRLGIPALIEENAPHGLQVLDSPVYPVSLAMGATFDRNAVFGVAKCVGEESVLSGIHVPNMSLLDMTCDPRFGRTEECLSEDPYLAAELCGSAVEGVKSAGAMLCCKHYCGQGAGLGGHCGGAANIGERELREIHLPSTKKAVEKGVDFIMATYNDVDGIRCHFNKHILKDILLDEFGFKGIIRADRMGVECGNDLIRAGADSLKAGVMLGLGDSAFTYLDEALQRGLVTEADLDEAVFRILCKKFESGVMDNPYIPEKHQTTEYLKSGASKKAAYECAAKSLVLLKNDNVLPFKQPLKLAVFGEHANDVYSILGDYTAPQKTENIPTIFDALKAQNPDVVYTKGWTFEGENDFGDALKIASEADAVIVTLGGSSVRDFFGSYNDKGQAVSTRSTFMDCGEGRDVSDLSLPGNQMEFLRKLKKLGKPVVSLCIQGRPYLLNEAVELSDALIIAWYPGMEGPKAIADAVFGKTNCFGRLPVSVPNSSGALPATYNQRTNNAYIDMEKVSIYSFGSGITYSETRYSNLSAGKNYSAEDIEDGQIVEVSVDVENKSDREVDEVVLLFIHASDGSIVRRNLELKGFKRVKLSAGEKKRVRFSLGKEELKVYAAENKYAVEKGEVELFVGGNSSNLIETKFNLN